jgi:hypothetical protein
MLTEWRLCTWTPSSGTRNRSMPTSPEARSEMQLVQIRCGPVGHKSGGPKEQRHTREHVMGRVIKTALVDPIKLYPHRPGSTRHLEWVSIKISTDGKSNQGLMLATFLYRKLKQEIAPRALFMCFQVGPIAGLHNNPQNNTTQKVRTSDWLTNVKLPCPCCMHATANIHKWIAVVGYVHKREGSQRNGMQRMPIHMIIWHNRHLARPLRRGRANGAVLTMWLCLLIRPVRT